MEWRSLPADLAREILSRVPAKSLAKLRSTSKQWNALLKSGLSAKTQAPKEESLIIMLIDSRVYLVRIRFRGTHGNKVAPSVKVGAQFYLRDPLSDSSQVDIRNVFHCDGLLLCTTEDNRLVVWNPCSGETKWIKPRDSYKESDCYALGYGNKSSCKQYKILRVDRQNHVNPNLQPHVSRIKNVYEVYDFTSDSWRVLGVATDWFLAEYRCGLSLKGNTYWVALGVTQVEESYPEFLLSFDFSTERFQSLPLPLPHPFPYMNVALSVVGEEQLGLLAANFKRWVIRFIEFPRVNLQLWVGTSTGSVMSWSKSLQVEGYHHHKLCNGMSFLADEQKEVVMYLSPNNSLHIVGENEHKEVDIIARDSTCISSCSALLNYVPSLARIQQASLPRGRKRKAPST